MTRQRGQPEHRYEVGDHTVGDGVRDACVLKHTHMPTWYKPGGRGRVDLWLEAITIGYRQPELLENQVRSRE